MQEKTNMMNIANELREIQDMSDDKKVLDKKIERIFTVLEYYCKLMNPGSHDEINCCSVAFQLCRLKQKGLGRRTAAFVDKYIDRLPDKAIEALRKNELVMEVY